MDNSCIKNSHALAKSNGASAAIIFEFSSSFMIFLMRAKGKAWCFASTICVFLISCRIFGQKLSTVGGGFLGTKRFEFFSGFSFGVKILELAVVVDPLLKSVSILQLISLSISLICRIEVVVNDDITLPSKLEETDADEDRSCGSVFVVHTSILIGVTVILLSN